MGGFVKIAVKTTDDKTLSAIVSTGRMNLFMFSRPLRNKDSEAIQTLLDELRWVEQEESHGVLGPVDYGLIYIDLQKGKAISSQSYTKYKDVFMLGARWEAREYCILPDDTPEHHKESVLLNQMLEDGCFTGVTCRASSLDPLSKNGLRTYPFGEDVNGEVLQLKDSFPAILNEAEKHLDDLYGLSLDLGIEFTYLPEHDYGLALEVEHLYGAPLSDLDKALFAQFAEDNNQD